MYCGEPNILGSQVILTNWFIFVLLSQVELYLKGSGPWLSIFPNAITTGL